jgi:hypothetical protein
MEIEAGQMYLRWPLRGEIQEQRAKRQGGISSHHNRHRQEEIESGRPTEVDVGEEGWKREKKGRLGER